MVALQERAHPAHLEGRQTRARAIGRPAIVGHAQDYRASAVWRLSAVDGGNVVFPPFDAAAVRSRVEGAVLASGAVPFIPGTSSVAHLREDLAAGRFTLAPRTLAELDEIAATAAAVKH